MNDVSPAILEAAKEYFDKKFYSNKNVKAIYKKVSRGEATYKEAIAFATSAGEVLSKAISQAFDGNLPNDIIYFNIAEKVLSPMLKQNYNLISEVSEFVQTDLNQKAGIGLKAVKPKFNKDRATGLVLELTNAVSTKITETEVAGQIKNFGQNIVDSFVKENLDFQSGSGLKVKISRVPVGKTCDWCKRLAYSGEYKGSGMPSEIFMRHRDCDCMIIYEGLDGRFQDVYSKKTFKNYQEAVGVQRDYLTKLDKMTPDERKEARNARARARRRAGFSDEEWAQRKQMESTIAAQKGTAREG